MKDIYKKSNIRAFHGTNEKFDKFRTAPEGKFGGLGETAIGAAFSESRDVAVSYPLGIREGQTRRIKEVQLDIRNPKKYTSINALRKDLLKFMKDNDLPIVPPSERLNNVKLFKKYLMDQGYDGIMYPEGYAWNTAKGKANTWVAFRPDQIKTPKRRK